MAVAILALTALFWNSTLGSAHGRTPGRKGALHKKSQPMAMERPSPDRMTRHERQLVQARVAATRRAQEKKFNMRAFDRDFDRITDRFGVGEDQNTGTQNNEQMNSNGTLPEGTKLRDAESGQVFFLQ